MEPSITDIAGLHRSAMELAEVSKSHQLRGWTECSQTTLEAAYRREKAAADGCLIQNAPEPTRSEILRSAAKLAIDCGEWVEAYRWVAAALRNRGLVPESIYSELVGLENQIEAHWREVQNGD